MCATAVHMTSIIAGDEQGQASVRCSQGAAGKGQGDAPASAASSRGPGVMQATARDEAGTSSASAEERERVLEYLQAIKVRKLISSLPPSAIIIPGDGTAQMLGTALQPLTDPVQSSGLMHGKGAIAQRTAPTMHITDETSCSRRSALQPSAHTHPAQLPPHSMKRSQRSIL